MQKLVGTHKLENCPNWLNYCVTTIESVFSARCISRCNIYISRLCYDVSVRLSVRLSVTKVHWRIIAILGFKFRSQFTAHVVSCSLGVKSAIYDCLVAYCFRRFRTYVRLFAGTEAGAGERSFREWTDVTRRRTVRGENA